MTAIDGVGVQAGSMYFSIVSASETCGCKRKSLSVRHDWTTEAFSLPQSSNWISCYLAVQQTDVRTSNGSPSFSGSINILSMTPSCKIVIGPQQVKSIRRSSKKKVIGKRAKQSREISGIK
jgi:hypothetical protein